MPESSLELEPFSLDCNDYRLILSREMRQRYRLVLWGTALFSLLVLLLIAWHAGSTGTFKLLRLWLPFFLLLGVWLCFNFSLRPRLSAANPLNRFLYATYTVKIEDGRLAATTDSGRISALPLHHVLKVSKQPDHYLIYTGAFSAIPIARTAFRDPELEDEFLRRLEAARSAPAAQQDEKRRPAS